MSTASTVNLVPLQFDFDEMEVDPLAPRKAQKKPWELLYDPELLLEENGELLMEDFRLSEEELKDYAFLCSRIRSGFRDKALVSSRIEAAQSRDEDSAISRLARSIEKSHYDAHKSPRKRLKKTVTDEVPIMQRRKGKYRAKLTT